MRKDSALTNSDKPPSGKAPGGSTPSGNPNVKLRTYFTSRKGKKFFAADYGHKCWPIGKSK